MGLLQVAAAGVLWGTGGLAVQLLREIAPMSVLTISGYRLLIATGVLLLALAAGRQLRGLPRLVRAHPRPVLVVGGCTATYQALYFASVVTVGVTVATVVSLGLAPLLLTAADAVRTRRRPPARTLVVLGSALGGLVLVAVATDGGGTGSHPWLGLLAAVGSGSAYALTTALGRSLSQRAGPTVITGATSAVGAVLLVPVGLAAALVTASPVATGDPAGWALLAYLGVLTMAVPYGLLYAGLRTTTSSAAVIATLLEPVTAAAVAALVLDERVGVVGLAGSALVLAAVAGLHRRPEPVPVPPG